MRFAFAGTPRFGAWVLHDLVDAGRAPALVVSQPPRPQGRGRRIEESPVARLAGQLGLPVICPEDVNQDDVIGSLRAAKVECLVVAAFGQLFSQSFLDALPCYNVHASLLPRYRGPAPIYWALRNGDAETGVSIMRIVRQLDAGPVALKVRLSLSPYDDGGSLTRALAMLGALAMSKVLQAIEDGTVTWTAQPDHDVSYAPKVTAADRELHLEQTARACHNHVRALSPDSAAELHCEDLRLKVLRTWPWEAESCHELPKDVRRACGQPGLIARSGSQRGRHRLFVGCGEGVLELLAVQPAGRNPMSAAEFLRGYGQRLGERLMTLSSPHISDQPTT